jgi:hypothetical protein
MGHQPDVLGHQPDVLDRAPRRRTRSARAWGRRGRSRTERRGLVSAAVLLPTVLAGLLPAGSAAASAQTRAAEPAPLRVSVTPSTILSGQPSQVCVRSQPGEVVALRAYTLPSRTYRVVRTGSSTSGLPCWTVRPGADTRLYASVVGGPTSRSSASRVLDVRPRPRAVEPVHGGAYTAVYLAVSRRADDPALARSVASASALGFRAVVGQGLSCDVGAAAGLGVDPAVVHHYTALYFPTRTGAVDFAAVHAPREARVVDVRTYCLD